MTELQTDLPATPPGGRPLLGFIDDEQVAGKFGLWFLQPESGVAYFDSDALRVLDWDINEVNRRWTDLQDAVAPRFRGALQHQLDEMKAGCGRGFVDFEIHQRSGVPREVRLQWSRHQCGSIMGALAHLRGGLRPVTDEVEARSLELKLHDAEVAARHRARLLAVVGHEMRKSLNGLLGLGQRPRMIDHTQPRTEQHQRWLDGILLAGKSMARLADDLVALGCADSHGTSVETSPKPLLPCLAAAWELANAAGGGNGTLHPIDLHDVSEETRVSYDAGRLQQVLLNLLSNADKYNRPGGSIWIDVRLQSRWCVIDIRDDGLGIAAHHLPRLFTDFFRADRAGSGTPGAGLGLVVSHALIVAMGGALEVESAEDRGSTFRIRLTLAPPSHGVDCDGQS